MFTNVWNFLLNYDTSTYPHKNTTHSISANAHLRGVFVVFLLPAEGWEVYKRGSLSVSQSVCQCVPKSLKALRKYGNLRKISRPET